MKEDSFPKFILPDWFDEAWEFETPIKEYLDGATVEMENGNRYKVYFTTPNRLRVEIDIMTEHGKPYRAEPGMIVLSHITVDKASQAVRLLAEEGFFEDLKPLSE